MKLLILGAGKMVEAILEGLKGKEDISEWGIYSPSGVSAKALALRVGCIHVAQLSDYPRPEAIILGCKPQQLAQAAATIGEQYKGVIFGSLLAAISEDQQRNVLGVKQLVRIMPNLAVGVGEGVTLLSSVSANPETFRSLFSKLGVVKILTEPELEELTLLTGSGPAFFYEFTKLLGESCHSLTSEEREELARQVLRGAGVVSGLRKKGLSSLVDEVTSKGGVTIAVLEEWRRRDLAGLLRAGVEAGIKRTQELKLLLMKN